MHIIFHLTIYIYIYIYPVPLSKDRNLLRKSRPTQGGHALAMPRKFRVSLSSGAKLKGTGNCDAGQNVKFEMRK